MTALDNAAKATAPGTANLLNRQLDGCLPVTQRKTSMPRISFRSLPLALLALSASAAFAVAPAEPVTRAQVLAELQQARQSGELLANGESSLKNNELFPGQYPQKTVSSEITRAQVLAELQQARQSGELLVNGESGLKNNELFPGQYPQESQSAGKTRAQVLEELHAAQRTGHVLAWGESGLTLNALYPQRYPTVH